MANVFDQFDENVFNQFDQEDSDPGISDYALSAVQGANELVPAIAGLPMDIARNVANLGIAGYGLARKEIGEAFGEKGYIPPETLPPMIGGSEWIKSKIEQGTNALGGGTPFGRPELETPGQQNARLAGGIIGAGLVAPGSMPRNALRMVPSAIGAVGMKETFPDQPLAPMVGMLAAPAVKPAIRSVTSKLSAPVQKAFIKAHKLGYRIPPALAKPSIVQQGVEGTAGPVPIKQKASIYNQKITNNLIKKDIGYHKDVPLSREGLDAVRAEAGKVYEKVKNIGKTPSGTWKLKTDQEFIDSVNRISKQNSALAKEFPDLIKKDVLKMTQGFNKPSFSSEAVIEAIKQLRADATTGFRSLDPQSNALARAQNNMAHALEKLLERRVPPNLVNELRAARQRIAKTYQVEKVLKGEDVDAVALGRDLDKGKPMSGLMRDVAEFGQNFKGAAQVNPPQQTNFRPMDLATGVGSAIATGEPGLLSLMAARPALRTAILSKPYQAMLAKQELAKISSLPKEAQAAAIASLVERLQNPSDSK